MSHKVFIFCSHPLPLIPCSLLDSFDTVPGHLTEDLHLYSLNDLTATRKRELGPRLSELTSAGATHVERCMVRKIHFNMRLNPCLGLRVVGWTQGSCHLKWPVSALCGKLDRVGIPWVGEQLNHPDLKNLKLEED